MSREVMQQSVLLEVALSVLTYDPTTGEFWWKVCAPKKVAGKKATNMNTRGYLQMRVNGHSVRAHRLAWAFVYGEFPSGYVDHINGDKTDNRIVNLRNASFAINSQNVRKPSSNNSSGFLGVTRNGNNWRAEIRISGKKKNLGTFSTPERAYEAYLSAKRTYHEGCTI